MMWLKQELNPTWSDIIDVMDTIGHRPLASRLRRKYAPESAYSTVTLNPVYEYSFR